MVNDATFFESLSWMENGRTPSLPRESTALWTLGAAAAVAGRLFQGVYI